jgi:hypothetical protein
MSCSSIWPRSRAARRPLQPAAGARRDDRHHDHSRVSRPRRGKHLRGRTMLIPIRRTAPTGFGAPFRFYRHTIRSTAEGLTDLDHLRELCAHGDVAGLMLTNRIRSAC